MDWYWYVIIGVGVGIIGYLKLTVWNKMKAKKKQSETHKDEED